MTIINKLAKSFVAAIGAAVMNGAVLATPVNAGEIQFYEFEHCQRHLFTMGDQDHSDMNLKRSSPIPNDTIQSVRFVDFAQFSYVELWNEARNRDKGGWIRLTAIQQRVNGCVTLGKDRTISGLHFEGSGRKKVKGRVSLIKVGALQPR